MEAGTNAVQGVRGLRLDVEVGGVDVREEEGEARGDDGGEIGGT